MAEMPRHETHRRRTSPGKARRQKQRGGMVLCPRGECRAANTVSQAECWRCGMGLRGEGVESVESEAEGSEA